MTSPTEALAHALAEQREKILAMVAGPSLDVEVQRVVFGTKHFYCRYGEPWIDEQAFYIPSGKPWKTHHIDALPVPRYSDRIKEAWLIVEWLVEMLPQHDLHIETMEGNGWKVGCCFTVGEGGFCANFEDWIEGETMPLAACRAALLARLETGP